MNTLGNLNTSTGDFVATSTGMPTHEDVIVLTQVIGLSACIIVALLAATFIAKIWK